VEEGQVNDNEWFFASVCTSMIFNHLLNMGVSDFVRHSKSGKNVSISMFLKPK
jgi:hypothetical protein